MNPIVRTCKNAIETQQGFELLLKKILSQNFPFNSKRHSFSITNGTVKNTEFISPERERLAYKMRESRSKHARKQLLAASKTADIDLLCQDPLFLVADESTDQEYHLFGPRYEQIYVAISDLRPIGLVEYTTQTPLALPEITSRVSVLIQGKVEFITEVAFHLAEEGKYEALSNSKVTYGQIDLQVENVSEMAFANLKKKILDASLFSYILQNMSRRN